MSTTHVERAVLMVLVLGLLFSGCSDSEEGRATGTSSSPTSRKALAGVVPWTRLTVGLDGRELTIHATGDARCGTTLTPDIAETSAEVRVTLIDKSTSGACDLLGEDVTMTARLDAPVGGRHVRDGGCERLFGSDDDRCDRARSVHELAANTCNLADIGLRVHITNVSNEAERVEVWGERPTRTECHLNVGYRVTAIDQSGTALDLGQYVLDRDLGPTSGALSTFLMSPVCQLSSPWRLHVQLADGTTAEQTVDRQTERCTTAPQKPRLTGDDLLP